MTAGVLSVEKIFLLRCNSLDRQRKLFFPARVAEVQAKLAPGTPIEVWCQDEMRVGQKNKLSYRWARKGSLPRATHHTGSGTSPRSRHGEFAREAPAAAILSPTPRADLSGPQVMDASARPLAVQPHLRAFGPVSRIGRISAGHRRCRGTTFNA
jgi:hypothetical protein